MRLSSLLLSASILVLARSSLAEPPVVEAPLTLPPAPTIDDPMLAPMPPAGRVVSTWEETLGLIRARSTDLRTAYDEILRAEGQVRTALAATLLTINGTATYEH